ncbi:septal ring lytic transglycosylase RlpA family protein, partial [Akkermansia sp.]|uniref:septal ring lytic transglycosylase RlpA family protein n=1 Tax=Akkermansia sp. TaxID=1872421 RepID=UPI003A88E5FA
YHMHAGINRGTAMLAGHLWLAACSSSPKSRDYPGYMTRPYTIRGHRYHPMSVEQALGFEQTGIASHYNECSLWGLVSGSTAIGENVRPWHLHAAHPTLPLPCEVLVQSLRTGKSVKVRVNDRGPFVRNRIIDLSEKAAERLDMKHHGLDRVRITVLSVGDGKWKREAPPLATPA